MNDKRYEIFISYRRKGGEKDARLIYRDLRARGYSVFLDVDSLRSCQFDESLFEYIRECDDLVLVLSPGALDRCWNKKDWLRREVEAAYKYNKRVTPVLVDNYVFPEKLPESLEFLRTQNGVKANMEMYDAYMDRLEEFLKSHSRNRLRRAGKLLLRFAEVGCLCFALFVIVTGNNVLPKLPDRKTPTVTTAPTPTAIPTVEPTATTTVYYTGEIGDSWEKIMAAIDEGSAEQRYAVGSWKPLDLRGYGTINMQLAGFNLDNRSDGKGKVATTWIAKELLLEKHNMLEYWNNWENSGWQRSDLRKWLQSNVLSAFPDDLRGRLVSVNKESTGSVSTTDTLWIPSYPEMFGKDSLYYGLFRDKNVNRVKTCNGASTWWWLRSANSNNFASIVGTNGGNGIRHVHNSSGVAIGFCL